MTTDTKNDTHDASRQPDNPSHDRLGSPPLYACLDVCTWSQPVSEVDEFDDEHEQVEGESSGPQAASKKRGKKIKKSKSLSTGQIAELIAIDKTSGGIRSQVQRFIHSLNSGGQLPDESSRCEFDATIDYHCDVWEVERQRQAKVLWDKGVGRALGFSSFRKYLATIPAISNTKRHASEHFEHLVLVDSRLSLKQVCRLAGVLYHCTDYTDSGEIRWMRCQDGSRYRDQSALEMSVNFNDDEQGMNVFEGIFLYMQVPQVISCGRSMVFCDPPNTGSGPMDAAKLCITELGPEVSWTFGDAANPHQGVASQLF